MTLTIGVDDAGRGPLIGPMILAGVLATGMQEQKLKREKIRDSKTVLQMERTILASFIKSHVTTYKIVKTYPEELDNALNTGTNLNTLEAIKSAQIINELNTKKYHDQKIKVIIDCPSVNTTAWCETLKKYITHKENLQIACEHKADQNHVTVAAGSILAKVTREEEVAILKKKYGDIGSGYPSDPFTKKFLKENGARLKDEGIFRKTWSTWKKLFPDKEQSTLGGF